MTSATPSLDAALRAVVREELRGVVRLELEQVVKDLQPGTAQPALMSVSKLAKALASSPSSVRRMMAKGCPHVKIGESPRFEMGEVMAWLREQKAA